MKTKTFTAFLRDFNGGKMVYLEDSVLWYALDMGVDFYLELNIHERINFKQSYYDLGNY